MKSPTWMSRNFMTNWNIKYSNTEQWSQQEADELEKLSLLAERYED
ncbi:hypothetical protein H8S90_20915 [Olivibacter sp. SDN3]|nr:hypothetical protein [Olivibacter sp. SDN3]QNL49176.1 hypothetical protein H8S90_20915 [Olivibacter sp. SDN3]